MGRDSALAQSVRHRAEPAHHAGPRREQALAARQRTSPSSEQRVPSIRAQPEFGDRRAKRAEGRDAPGKTGRRKQVRRKMRIDVQILSRQESTAGKASPCVHGGDPVREA